MRFPIRLAVYTALLSVGTVCADEPSLGKMPPKHLAVVTRQREKDEEIVWSEAQGGLAVGVGAVETSFKSPLCPVFEAYLENRGISALDEIIQSQSRFLLELDGRFYAEVDDGGRYSAMAPGQRYGPIAVNTQRFREIARLAPFPAPGDKSSPPILTEGQHTLRLHYRVNGNLVSSKPITIKVRLSPYSEPEAVAAITRELKHADSYVRQTAVLAATNLRLTGCRTALSRSLEDPDGVVRRYSAEALGEFGDRADIAPLKALVNDPDMDVRLAAAESLVKLGESLDVAWVEPIIKSKHSAFQNAIWLVRRHSGASAAPALIRCLDSEDPSVKSYYNYTLVWQIAACGGPQLRYHHDFDGMGTQEQIDENRKVMTHLQEWMSQQISPK